MTDAAETPDEARRLLDETRRHRIGNNVRAERARRNLTQQQVGERAGVHKQTIIAIEGGKVDTSINTIWHIADALGLDVTELFQ